MAKKNDTIRECLLKIKALHDGAATEGERQSAQSKLEQLLNTHGIKLSELEAPQKDWHCFTYANKREHRLLCQIFGKVTGWKTKTIDYRENKTRRQAWFELTPAEYADMKILFAFYRKEWETMLDDFFTAFLSKQGLGMPVDDEEREMSLVDLAMAVRVRTLMKAQARLESPLAAGYLPNGL